MRNPGDAFKIAVPEAVLSDLAQRLARTRWPAPAPGPDWGMGTSVPFMKDVVAHWLQGYDWRRWEARLNGFEQYRVEVGGIGIHCFVERGGGPDPMPLVLTHGWPGSAVELIEMIEPLAHPERFGGALEDAFTVVVPSLPGCGFSDPPDGPISPRDVGKLWGELMHDAFGFGRYMAHGGDWGAVVTSWMGVDHPPGLLGLHLNTAVLQAAWSFAAQPLTAEEETHVQRMADRQVGETAYQMVHATRPQSLAFGITDSPVGLAAWILEKFQAWTVERGSDAPPPFDLDHLITNVMFYWLGDAQAVSWMYRYLMDRSGFLLPEGVRVTLPAGFCLFPQDIAVPPPDAWLKRAHDVVHCTRAAAGGHFPGLEHPQVLVDDIRTFRRLLEHRHP